MKVTKNDAMEYLVNRLGNDKAFAKKVANLIYKDYRKSAKFKDAVVTWKSGTNTPKSTASNENDDWSDVNAK